MSSDNKDAPIESTSTSLVPETDNAHETAAHRRLQAYLMHRAQRDPEILPKLLSRLLLKVWRRAPSHRRSSRPERRGRPRAAGGSADSRARADRSTAYTSAYEYDSRPRITLHIGGQRFRGLVDSGAVSSYISENTSRRLGRTARRQSIQTVMIRLADGSQNSTRCQIIAETRVGNYEGQHTFLEMPGLVEDVIVGIELLRLAGFKWSLPGSTSSQEAPPDAPTTAWSSAPPSPSPPPLVTIRPPVATARSPAPPPADQRQSYLLGQELLPGQTRSYRRTEGTYVAKRREDGTLRVHLRPSAPLPKW